MSDWPQAARPAQAGVASSPPMPQNTDQPYGADEQQQQPPPPPRTPSSHAPPAFSTMNRTASSASTSSNPYQPPPSRSNRNGPSPLVPTSAGAATPSVAVAASASASTNQGQRSQHALSLKVMRISAPQLHTADRLYHEDAFQRALPSSTIWKQHNVGNLSLEEKGELERASSHPHDSLLPAFSSSLTAALSEDMLSNEGTAAATGASSGAGPSTLRDWPLSSIQTLPNAFGTLYLGETFSAYLCVRNEARHAVRDASLRVEMQVGDGGDSTGRASGSRTLLADILASAQTDAEDDQQVELQPDGKLETTARHELRELGPHVLICTVSYKTPIQQGAEVAWVEANFRKFYKFAVPASPLSVRTKTHEARSALQAMHPDHRVRERVLLEVQVQNVSPSPLVFERLDLRPEPGWTWRSIDRPGLHSNGNVCDEDYSGCIDIWQGANEFLLPEDVRQYLFQLSPQSDRPAHPILPLPLTPATTAAHPGHGGPALASTPDRRSLPGLGSRSPGPSSLRRPYEATSEATHRPQGEARTPLATTMLAEPIGSLDIAWRMSEGEPGRLQTSQLVRRRAVPLPVRCLADTPGLSAAARADEHELPYIPEAGRAAASQDPTQTQTPRSALKQLAPALVPSHGPPQTEDGLPPPLIEANLNLASATDLPILGEAQRDRSITLPLHLWIRDLAAFSMASLAKDGARSQISPAAADDDDSDDDRPLSEFASPRHGSEQLPSTSSRRSSAVSAAATKHIATGPHVVGGRRTLFLAAQHLARPAQDEESNKAMASAVPDGDGSGRNSTAARNSEDTPLRSENSSLLRSLTSPSTPSRQPLRRSLQQNLVANLAASPLLRAGSLGGRRSGAVDEQGSGYSNGSQSRSASPAFPPTPPPKERHDPLDGSAPSAVPAIDAHESDGSSARIWPRPRLNLDAVPSGADLPDSEGEDFERWGASLVALPPVTIAFEASAGGDVGQATVEFDIEVTPLRNGLVRIGGLRLLVLGWEDEVVSRAEDGSEQKSTSDRVELRSPIRIREWPVVTELFVR